MFDSEARLPLDSQLVRGAAEVPLIVVVSRAASRLATDALEAAGAEVIVATGENEPARVRSALDQLGAIGITSILLEGGPHLAGAFLDAGEVDEIRALHRAGGARRLATRATRSRARAPSGSPRRSRALRARRRADRRRRADLRADAGVVGVFTGLVADLGTVVGVEATADGVRARASRPRSRPSSSEGDSVAVNGVCLTATAIADGAASPPT